MISLSSPAVPSGVGARQPTTACPRAGMTAVATGACACASHSTRAAPPATSTTAWCVGASSTTTAPGSTAFERRAGPPPGCVPSDATGTRVVEGTPSATPVAITRLLPSALRVTATRGSSVTTCTLSSESAVPPAAVLDSAPLPVARFNSARATPPRPAVETPTITAESAAAAGMMARQDTWAGSLCVQAQDTSPLRPCMRTTDGPQSTRTSLESPPLKSTTGWAPREPAAAAWGRMVLSQTSSPERSHRRTMSAPSPVTEATASEPCAGLRA
mmetsp:Transcript_3619/g.10672  ORF Transcript_3619/g.10672 Transcript_3619/m.10672 type:complete len:273 (-) Transcript_3619:279-1097(-)